MERFGDYGLDQAEVLSVEEGSIAEDLGLGRGDCLLELNGCRLKDVFDYRLREQEEELTLLVRKANGEEVLFEIEKDEDEELGIVFENPLLAHCESCSNHCIFCFIDQLPPGMRKSLYFKDDDSRLSFLTGNYITLTNMSERELDRILSYHLSPLNISVHATDAQLRRKLLGNRRAGELMERLRKIAGAGIQINAQFVLIPGLNDGAAFDQSLRDLENLGDALASVACVPVGVTRWREHKHLYPLRIFNKDEAGAVLRLVEAWQEKFLKSRKRRLVYAADEFYFLAGEDLPEPSCYEGFPQLENGVGMASLFLSEVRDVLRGDKEVPPVLSRDLGSTAGSMKVRLASGRLGAELLERVREDCSRRFGLELKVQSIKNEVFGETVTVTGLLCGKDLLRQLDGQLEAGEILLICDSMLRGEENIFLDDFSLEELAEGLNCRVCACGESGLAFMSALEALRKEARRCG